MKIVIDVPEEYLDSEVIHITAVTGVNNKITDVNVEGAYAEFQVLPKGYGELIDKSKIYKAIPAEEDNSTGMGMTREERDAYNEGIDAMYSRVQGAQPIIEADKDQQYPYDL